TRKGWHNPIPKMQRLITTTPHQLLEWRVKNSAYH
ncbi:MAG: hypothetical protein ACI92E_003064, partial [Oceanicoccus sp.]